MSVLKSIAALNRDRRGAVMIMFALFLAGLAATASFSLDLSRMYFVRQQNQLIGDLATLSAINTDSPIVGSNASANAVATARAVAIANHVDPADVLVTVTPSPADAAALALRTTIQMDVALPIGIMSAFSDVPVYVASWGQADAAGACFRSQLGPTNIYGNSVVDAPSCGAEAKTFLYSCGGSVTTLNSVRTGYSSTAERPYLCNGAVITPGAASFSYKAKVTDTIAASTPVTGMLGRLNAMAGGWPYGTSSPVNPPVSPGTSQSYVNQNVSIPANSRFAALSVTNSTIAFAGSGAPDPTCASPTTIAATLTLSGNNQITFGSGCYVFAAAFNVPAAGNSRLSVSPGASVVFVFKGTMTVAAGAQLVFGDATSYFNGGSIANYGTRLEFGNGPFYLWGGTIYNVSAGSTLAFGSGPFYFYGGSISNSGTMTLGNGPFWFSGGSLALNPASTTSFGAGDMNFYGGTVIAGGASVTFGAGGSAETGSGAVMMYGGSFALTAQSITAIGTSFGFKGGTLSLLGVGTINATAPTSPNPALGYRNLLFGIWGGAFNLYQSGGQMDTMSGMVYAPSTNASIYGSQTVTPPAGGCFGVVSGVLDIYQNARVNGAPCAGLAGSSAGNGRLVQ